MKRRTVKKLTRSQRLSEIRDLVNICFGCLDKLTIQQVADRTGLCYQTVHRLYYNEFTLRVTIGSIQALSYAAGFKIELNKGRIYLSAAA